MRIVCLQENLSNALLLTNRIVSQKIQLPVLSNILLTAQKNIFNISATDLEMGIKVNVPAKIEKEGEIIVPAKTLYEFVSLLTPGQIEIEAENQTLRLETRNQKANFLGASALEFPKLDTTKQKKTISLEPDLIRVIVRSVGFAAANDTVRPTLSGVLFNKEGKTYSFVATDGYRLSFKKTEAGGPDANVRFIVPGRLLKELGFLIEKYKEKEQDIDVFITQQENQIKFMMGGNILVGRLIEGEFPNYEKIIPQSANTTALFDKEDFLSSIKTAAVIARDNANIVRLGIKEGKVLVSANAPQIGENKSLVEAKTTGDDNEIAFNSHFLLEFLTSVEEKEMLFEMTGPLNPGVFRIPNDNSFFHIIMPVRVQD